MEGGEQGGGGDYFSWFLIQGVKLAGTRAGERRAGRWVVAGQKSRRGWCRWTVYKGQHALHLLCQLPWFSHCISSITDVPQSRSYFVRACCVFSTSFAYFYLAGWFSNVVQYENDQRVVLVSFSCGLYVKKVKLT